MSRQLTPEEQAFILGKLQREDGITPIDAPETMHTMVRYLSEIVPPELVALAENATDLFFLYDMERDNVPHDGKSVWDTNSAGREVTALGMATQAIRQGRDYAVMVFLHELAHLITREPGHTAAFHQYLDYLLSEVETFSGIPVKNDYYGLSPDLRPDAPN